jgi:uncharacterized protein (DUF3084 family)
MYGDMSQLRAKARTLRAHADDLRARSATVASDAGSMSWNSRAGDALRSRVRDTHDALGQRARALDEAAAALEAHAAAVDHVKDEIAAAERVASSILAAAQHLVANVVHKVEDVAQTAVSGLMSIVGNAVNGAPNAVRVAYYALGGQQIPASSVDQAKTLVARVPVAPPTGSKDWLEVRAEAQRAGLG